MQCSADFEGQLPHRSRFISPVPFGNGLFLLLKGGPEEAWLFRRVVSSLGKGVPGRAAPPLPFVAGPERFWRGSGLG